MRKQTNFQKAIEKAVTKNRNYGKKPREFYDNEGKCPECLEYMENLGTNLVPFDCEHMRILFQDMKVRRREGPSMKYKQGELLCLKLARKRISRRCGLSKKISPINNGEFEVLCKEGSYKFRLKNIK